MPRKGQAGPDNHRGAASECLGTILPCQPPAPWDTAKDIGPEAIAGSEWDSAQFSQKPQFLFCTMRMEGPVATCLVAG